MNCLFCDSKFSRKDAIKRHILNKKCSLKNLEDSNKLWNLYEKIGNPVTINVIQNQNINQYVEKMAIKVDINNNDNNQDDIELIYNYIYILREREFIKTDEQIYKIGKSNRKPFDRFKKYPKGTKLEFIISVDDCDSKEKEIKEIFSNLYKKRTDIGQEYFEGDLKLMKDTVYNICNM